MCKGSLEQVRIRIERDSHRPFALVAVFSNADPITCEQDRDHCTDH